MAAIASGKTMHRNRQCVAFTRRTPNRINQMETACSASVLETISSARGHRGRKRTSAGQQSRAEEASRDEGERAGRVDGQGILQLLWSASDSDSTTHPSRPSALVTSPIKTSATGRGSNREGHNNNRPRQQGNVIHHGLSNARALVRGMGVRTHTLRTGPACQSAASKLGRSRLLSHFRSLSLTPSAMLRIRRG